MATDYKTLRVPKDAYDQAQADKRDTETWGEFLQRCADTPPEIIQYVDADRLSTDTDVDLSPVLNRLDDLETELTSQHERLTR